jgi:hypothetical protein
MTRFERSAQVRCSAAGGGSSGNGSNGAAAGAAAGAKKGGGTAAAKKGATGKAAAAAAAGGGGGGSASENFRDYFAFSRPLSHVSSHTWLALHRGAEQKVPLRPQPFAASPRHRPQP